ncbi:Uncharacterized protein, contains a NRPS condensation (elongation) domain [Sporobacter termitidis DSM 10068]|uniref:Uncharacterized protein, contains a NRPS condensation (Elongation) domain n=1 Tax=Sporobacter termitidis DSM 10068 TaxID=1123282 RepID=A0A1M5YDC1_9FIRM|nr:hypothetical protein [Sporobacter termitidis]SHI09838.1 Uncharacterized protein, contains a NRPS condensation (elongation) domain [Sporobacter termitidis DSM 10068]
MKAQKYVEWSRLDNASKIFPATWTLKDPKVFRIACELTEAVKPELLQKALDQTIDDIPVYKSVLRRGMFWYYMEKSDMRPEAHMESNTVCAPIYVGLRYNLLFRVSFFKNRINLEVFHALSDGAGALRFLQTLVHYYIILIGKGKFENTAAATDNASVSGLMDDSFGKHFIGQCGKRNRADVKDAKAYQIRGVRFDDNRMQLIEGSMSAKKVLDEAHKNDVTLTAYLASLFVYAIGKEMRARGRKYPVVLTVPVNLRQYYESVTVRNFFGFINISYRFDSDTEDLTTVIQGISERFKKALTVEQLDYQSNKYMSIERNLFARIVPLPIKDLVARLVVSKSVRHTTSIISNIGKITMPLEFAPYIRQFSVCTSAPRPQMTLCSYGDRLVVSISSPYRETDIQRNFFRVLSDYGIDIEISSSF